MAAKEMTHEEKVRAIVGKVSATIPNGRCSAQGVITEILGDGQVTINAAGRLVTGFPLTPVSEMRS